MSTAIHGDMTRRVVVHTADVTMVCPVGDAERVKQLLAAVEELHGARYS